MPLPSSQAADALIDGLQQVLQASTGRPVRCVQTHISWVLLDGEHAWKIKKPVRLGFLDFSELALRRQACEDELRLNRRLAPALYLDVVPIHGSARAPRLGGDGEPIEYALRMKQFAAGALLSERLAAGTLDAQSIDRLAARLAAFHAAAPAAGGDTPHGDPAVILAATSQVLAGLEAQAGVRAVADLRDWCEAQGRRLRARFAARKRQGWVREGHGDLHLDNLVILGEEVTAFDCIEFDPGLRWIDVQSDIAFFIMDLAAHGRSDLAFRFLDRWLEGCGDYAGVAVLRYYAVYRALVRALVSGLRRAEGLAAAGPDYVAAARRLAQATDARLLITHGLSGSGKSHLTQRLLEIAGAIRLRSDVERKRLFGLHPLDSSAPMAQGIYTPAATRRTYARLLESAAAVLDAGYPVIVDAAFLRARERAAFRRLADSKGVPFTILHCHAEPAVLRQRVRARSTRRDDASEADLAVLDRQLATGEPLGADERAACIDVDTTLPPDIGAIAAHWLALR
ncbi:MAG: AAA family ATPase [Thiomonas sp.]